MKPICVFNGNQANFNFIKSVYPSATITDDTLMGNPIKCISLSSEEYVKWEADTMLVLELKSKMGS